MIQIFLGANDLQILQQILTCVTWLPVGQNYDYISDNVRFNQDAEDKQDWNCYTKRCTVTKKNYYLQLS